MNQKRHKKLMQVVVIITIAIVLIGIIAPFMAMMPAGQ
jgi:hypothetical protein